MTATETRTSHREHGTRAKYVADRCRCEPCREAARIAQREARNRAQPPYVSATEARRHVEWLRTQGVGLKTIAKASGVSHGALSKLVYGDSAKGLGPSKRVRPATAEKILAVTPADAADGARVDAAPTWAIIDRLVAAGMPKTQIAERIGQQGPGLQLSRDFVEARHARAIAELGRQLDDGTLKWEQRWRDRVTVTRVEIERRNEAHTRAVLRARQRGEQSPPLIWDDIDALVAELADVLEERIEQASWRRHAECVGEPTWMFFPGRGDRKAVAAARRVCDRCGVREQCLDANWNARQGIFGGKGERQRRGPRRTP